MIGIEAAQKRIRESIAPTDSVELSLTEIMGRVLSEDIASDTDSPPYDKSLVDGYAVLSSDIAAGRLDLEILEEVVAGDVPRHTVTSGKATRIMTGAPLPPGADAVIMVERTRTTDARVVINAEPVVPGQAIMRQGLSMKRGQVVLRSGARLRSIEVGLLAEVGRATARVHRTPSVALIQTGDELVSAGEPLRAGQIRNSNGPMLQALVKRAGATPIDLGIARDEEAALAERIGKGLEADFLIVSGGVSAGVKDLVPSVLADAGVHEIFHKVDIRPGKPLWFGSTDLSSPGQSFVFGLPGNPVSSLVCFWVFVAPAIAWRAGQTADGLSFATARLGSRHTIRGTRPTFWPAKRQIADRLDQRVDLLDWQGSADLFSLAAANCLVFFPEGNREYAASETVRIVTLD